MGALYKGLIATGVLSLPALALVIHWLVGFGVPVKAGALTFSSTALFWCGVVGLAVTGLIVWITEYYTGTNFRPVQSIAKASEHRPRHQRHPGPGDFARSRPRCRPSSSSPAS